MKKYLFALIGLLMIQSVNSQLKYEKRIEFELKDGYADEKMFTFGERGLLMRSKKIERVENDEEWKFDFYSTDITLETTKTFRVDRKYYLDETTQINGRLHSFFRNKKGEYALHSIDSKTMEEFVVKGSFPKKTWVQEMLIIGDYAHFYTRFKKRELYLYSLNWKTGESKKTPINIPNYKTKSLSLLRMQQFEETDELLVFVRAVSGMKTNEIVVVRYDSQGNYLERFLLTEDVERNFISISASPIGDKHYVFTGTYSSNKTNSSQGLYFCESENGKMNYVEYYNFADLENFFTYISDRKQEKIEKKKERKKKKGRELKFKYLIADHPVIVLDEGYLFIGEAYYPTYRTETYTTYSNGVAVTQTRQVFDGYQYTHAVVTRYNKYGEMVWDQIFEMYPSYKPFFVKRFISIAEGDQDALNLVFASRSRIVSKSFSYEGEVISDRTSDPIETGLDGDKTKWSNSNVDYWYDDYFIAYGRQKIKNKEKGQRKRFVYFVNKIKFE